MSEPDDPNPLPPSNTLEQSQPSMPEPEPTPMLDIHPAHHAASTWRDFFIHIATIVLGLLIAISLEQTVEYFHHRHQVHQLEKNLRDELRRDLGKDSEDFRKFGEIRAYFVTLKAAVSSRRTGKPVPPPPATDTRRQQVPTAPSIAIWEAAKLDATIPLLPSNEIQLYNGIVLQHGLMFAAIDDFQHSGFALQSFEERFVDATGGFDFGDSAPLPNLDTMSAAELAEYESLLATYIKSIDRLVMRIHFFDRTARAILDGATSRDDVIRRAFPGQTSPEPGPSPGVAAHH